MKQLNKFIEKLDKNPVKLSELKVGQIVLARVRITARKLVFQPVRITTLKVAPNHNGYPVLTVERMNGLTDFLYCRDMDGEVVAIDMKVNGVDAWKKNEVKKLTKECSEIQSRIDIISTFGE